jgi:8-oxo-dGDP phosphatase
VVASGGRNLLVARSGQNDDVDNEPRDTVQATQITQNDQASPDTSTTSTTKTTSDTETTSGDGPEVRMLSTRVVYVDDWVTFRRDEIERRDGSRGSYAYVQKRNFALIIPAENGGFHLVEEYRYPLGRRGWSFPQGGFPPDESGTAEELARMELAQETGLRAARMTHLGSVAAGHGITDQYGEYFLATELTPGPADLEPEELGLKCEWVPRAEFEQMARDGRIVDDSTLAAYTVLLLAERHGGVRVP